MSGNGAPASRPRLGLPAAGEGGRGPTVTLDSSLLLLIMVFTKEGMVLGAAPLIALAVSAFALSAPAFSGQDQKKFLEEERRKEMDARPKPDPDMVQPLLWDAGGWLHLQFDQLDDPPLRDTRTDRY